MPETRPSNYDIITAMVESGFSPTKSEARRVIEQKGVKLNEVVVDDIKKTIQKGDIIQKGKRFFVRII